MAARWRSIRACKALTLVAALGATPVAAAPVTVEGSTLVVRDAAGDALPTEALLGAILDLDADIRVRIAAIRSDPWTPGGDVMLYDLQIADGDAWAPVCEVDAEGRRAAILQPGPDGTIAILCTAGALAKCIRFGYRPWAVAPGGQPLAPYWRACVHMVRADYCGDDQPTTRDNMLIDVFDRIGVQIAAPGDTGVSFEAAWGESGAVCVAHPRVPQNISLVRLAAQCPRLRGHLGPGCTAAAGALIYNASRGDGLPEAVSPSP